jgi:hypothetical protein
MSKLIHIEGIGSDEVELLEATGWTDPHALAKANPELLVKEITAANEMLRIVARTPERHTVEHWISSAARFLDPTVPKKRRSRSRAAVADDAPAKPARRGGRKSAKVAVPDMPVVEEAPAEVPAAVVDSGEAALEALTGPVNFEAEPDVIEMLSVAPFALPIPARTLAEKGIAPSEIPVAPLLNRALGDLDVRVTVERPRRKDLPAAPGDGRRAGAAAAVQVADLGFSFGRRGFDPSKIRTIEDAQGDAPLVRVATAKSGPEDERLTLLRSPRPETNAGRDPKSRFYIRGVLHDRPFVVWFGGLFVVLLQLCVPLAVIAAPLLILSDQVPEKFSWVPGWVIAFPIALPLLALLYGLVGARAKCRVCAQRMYVPKHCLKNRKAHHLPLLGHIGAVALHVMVFKWFNCTFCGTSIRIKK